MTQKLVLVALSYDDKLETHVFAGIWRWFNDGIIDEWWIASDSNELLGAADLDPAIFVAGGRSQEAMQLLCDNGFCIHGINGQSCDSEPAERKSD